MQALQSVLAVPEIDGFPIKKRSIHRPPDASGRERRQLPQRRLYSYVRGRLLVLFERGSANSLFGKNTTASHPV